MKIIWNGHSCFTLQSAQGTVVIDPFADNYVPGCGVIRPEADGVYCSHGHNDHGCAEVVILSGKGHTVEVETVPSFHDEAQGTKRGSNLIHIFTAEGMRCVHLGDLGCELNEEQITAAFINGLQALNESLPPYITADFKVSKTALKEYIEKEKLKPAGVEIVENWSLRIK